MIDSERLQLGEVIAEGAGLRRAPPCAGDHVPPFRVLDAGPAGPRIGVDDDAARQRREIDDGAVRGLERDGRYAGAHEMAGRAVVDRRGNGGPISRFLNSPFPGAWNEA